MAGYPHYLEQQRLISSKGTGYGGSIYFYYTGTTVKAPIYSDAALTVPAANPVVVSAGAVVPDIYLSTAVTYRRYIVYSNGETDNLDPYVIPSNAYTDAKFSDLASTATGKGDALVGSDDGAGGSLWSTVKGFISYLRSSAGAGIVGYIASWANAVVRTIKAKLDDTVSVKDFGAKGDGKYAYSGAMTSGSAVLTVSLSGFSGFTSADVGKAVVVPGAGAAGASLTTTIAGYTSSTTVTLAATASTTVSGATVFFGTNDTTAIQKFFDYLTPSNNLGGSGFFPDGYYCITGTINVATRPGWSVIGGGTENTAIVQITDNIPIIDFGAVAGSAMHSIWFEGFRLTYAAPQPSTNTNAFCMVFSTMAYWFTMNRVTFENGYDGIKVRSGVGGPWGCSWDVLRFRQTLTGSAMDWSGATNGVPNNRWGRIVVEMNSMTKTAFKQVKGYNWTIDTIELLGSTSNNVAGGTGQQWFEFQAGASVDIGALKLETFNYTGAHGFSNSSLIYAQSCAIHIGQLFLGGSQSVFNPSASLSVVGGAVRDFTVDFLQTSLSVSPSTNVSISAANTGRVRIGRYQNDTFTIPITSVGGGTSSNFLTYDWNAVRRLSDDIGNADYTLASNGGPTIIVAQTALTAPRTVEIMSDTNYLFNGYTVTVLSRGAVNGANTITIKAGGITKATISSDNYAVTLTWRRNPTAHNGWVITQQGAA